MEAEHVAKELEIAGKVECMAKKPAYITLKDRKENFNIYPKCHLINPAKIDSFDIKMGSYDGAKIYELVGLYILCILGRVYGIQNVGLYRDDGLAYLHKISGSASDKIRKDIIRTSQENFGLEITMITNLKTFNFLDVTFNLCTGKYQPYKKPSDTPTCINFKSNHPPNIIKALPDTE